MKNLTVSLSEKFHKALSDTRKTFSFGEFTFVPVFVFSDLGLKATLKDVSPHLTDTGKEPCFTKDPGRTARSAVKWNHKGFYYAAKECPEDIFYCLENRQFYCPCENTLFRFDHPGLITLR